MADPTSAGQQWYVMLFPAEGERQAIVERLRPLAERTGGEVNGDLHVTIGYFRGAATAEAVVERVRPLDRPQIVVHAAELFSFSELPNPLFGWTLSLRVRREGAVQGWQRMVRDALAPLPLAPVFSWQEQQPHMNVVLQLPVPPSEALARLDNRDLALAFTATRVVVSERVGDTFVNRLEHGLRG